MMKMMRQSVSALVILAAMGAPAAAQSGPIERTLDAISSMAEQLMVRVSSAMNFGSDRDGEWTQSATDFRWSGSLEDGDALEIKGINGSISVEVAAGRDIVVTAESRGRRSDAASVRIDRVEHENGVTFCAVYPTPKGKRENFCGAGEDGRMSTEHNDVQVHFRVQLPAGVSFVGRNVNGDIEAIDLDSDVTANTVNGDIDISTSGFATAETVNGSIDASMGSLELGSGLKFSTVNGSITLDLPDDVDANVDARWLNGDFESELPFAVQGRLSRTRARGTLGDGGKDLELSTVNGSIQIR